MKKFTNYFYLLAVFILLTGTSKMKAQCVASFNYSVGINGYVTFTSTSVGTNSVVTNYYWNFGNSTYSAGIGVTSPSTTYTSNGTYTVSMTFTNPCTSNTTAVITITNVTSGCSLNAGLGYSQGNNGLVYFYDTSTGTVPGTTYTLDYGDSSPTASIFTSHTYSANGTYTATLIADNNSTPTCTSVNVFTVNVTSICPFVPSFTYNVGSNGLVSFQSTSTGTTSSNYYNWYFGDGSPSAAGTNFVNPAHTYANGTYTVWLTITNNSVAPTCTMNTQQVITVTTNTCNLAASFTHTTGPNGLVNFNSTSTGTLVNTTYSWNFGDGTTGTGSSPPHTYSSSGPYPVSLMAMNGSSTCVSNASQNVNVTSANCIANAGFSVAPTNTAQVWTATPSFPWNVIGAVWSWGDGTSSWGMYSMHSYSASATYSICLTVTVSCGATATSCSSYFIFKPTQDMQMIQINVVQPALVPAAIEATDINAVNFEVYPNPNNGEFKLGLYNELKEDAQITVYSITGGIVYESAKTETIRLNNISNGVYFIKIKSGDNIQTKKLIVNR